MNQILDTFIALVILGFTVEAVVETLKLLLVKGKISLATILSLLVGIVISLTVNFDILIILGFNPVIPYVGVILAGILISRGGNFIHILFDKYNNAGSSKVATFYTANSVDTKEV